MSHDPVAVLRDLHRQAFGPYQRVDRRPAAQGPGLALAALDRHGAAEHGHCPAALQLGGNPVHDSDELGDERGGRLGVYLIGRGDLLQLAQPHDPDPVGHRQCFLLVVGDEQGGGAEPLLQRADLLAQLQAHLGVEGGQRLIQQQHPGLDGERAGQRHPLLLTAGQLVRVLLRLRRQADHVQQLSGPRAPLARGQLAHPQPEGDVVERGHVREEAVALEHHAHVTPGGRHRQHVLAVDEDRSGVRRLEARHYAQRRRLAAAGGSEQCDELARGDLE